MADKIDTSIAGIDVTRADWKQVDPDQSNDPDYDKLRNTLWKLVYGHNEYQDRIQALEGRLNNLPFGVASS